jgi:hypothetical protein
VGLGGQVRAFRGLRAHTCPLPDTAPRSRLFLRFKESSHKAAQVCRCAGCCAWRLQRLRRSMRIVLIPLDAESSFRDGATRLIPVFIKSTRRRMRDQITKLYGCRAVYGPYPSKDGRRRCVLYFGGGRTASKAYARLLIEADLGRLLRLDEHVDHIDGNRANDARANLQVLDVSAHRTKSATEQSARRCRKATIFCPVCLTAFKAANWRLERTTAPCCSLVCARKLKWGNQHGSGGMMAEGGGVEPPRRY